MRSIGEVTAALASIRSLTWRQWLVAIFALAIFVAPLPRLYGATATSMEEGSILEYATLTLHGSVPTKDYWTEYGPLNVYVPTVAFAITGPSVPVERTLGLAYRAVLIAALFSLLRRFSRRGAWICALLSWFAIAPFGLMAYSLIGGLGFTLAGLALLTRALDSDPPPALELVGAGVAFGVGLGFRPDLILVAALPAIVLLWRRRRTLRPLLLSTGATIAVPYGILLATAGLHNVLRCLFIDPLIHLRAGRALPVPPSFSLVGEYFTRVTAYSDALTGHNWLGAQASVQIAEFFWVMVAIGVVLILSIVGPLRSRDRRWIALAVAALLLASDFLQRTDLSHMRQVGCVWLAVAPTATMVILRKRFTHREVTVGWATVGLSLIIFLVAPVQVVLGFTDLFRAAPHQRDNRTVVVSHEGRTVPTGSWIEAAFMHQIVNEVSHHSRPGQLFFEGPVDLRFTNYNEPILYWMEPQLHPSTYYLEMNPGISNAASSGLAAEVRNADVVVLSKRYVAFNEPNSSTRPGSNAPNVVIAQHFCFQISNPFYVVLTKVHGRVLDPTAMAKRDVLRVGNHLEARCSAVGPRPSSGR
jgi:hypothetical protein